MRVILVTPEIPQNVGNIARTCAVTATSLVLVRPLGFSLCSRQLKRAGLDYWADVPLTIVDSLESALESGSCYFFSTKGQLAYTSLRFDADTSLVFGSETAGFPQWIYKDPSLTLARIPMRPNARSLNVATAVGIVLYEAFRQQNFNGIE